MMLPRRTLLLGGLSGILVGCADQARPVGIVPIAPGIVLRLPDAASLGRSVEAAQMVRANDRGRVFAFEGQISVTPERVLLACIDPLGRLGLTLRWGQGRLDTQVAPWFPATIRAENILADIMLIYWPLDSLRRGLAGSGAEVMDESDSRMVLLGSQPLIRVAYNAADRWNATSVYSSIIWGYRLDVRSVEVAA